MAKHAVIVLAAGASSRMGEPKQLLGYNGGTLLQHACEVALRSANDQVWVVLGANAAEIIPTLKRFALRITVNPDWEEGMAASIRCGLFSLIQAEPDTAAVTLILADQPLLSSRQLDALAEQQESTGKGIIASAYGGSLGTPVIFTRKYFQELLNLEGQAGAKTLLQLHADDVLAVPFPEGIVDIDTPEDYRNLLRTKC